jgi:hypothetical protein
VDSEWCTREAREFCKIAEQTGGLVLQNKSRVIKVIKTPVESEEALPPVMKSTLGYLFYAFDDEQTPLELDPAYGDEMAQKYNLRVAKLAWDISQLLKKLRAATPKATAFAEPTRSKPTIYLAECSYDRREAREALESDLRLHGYTILPDCQLPRDEAEYATQVLRLLEESMLSVHLVGSNYGAVPDGPSQKSIVALQNELAIQRSRTTGLRRVIWLPEGTASLHSEQQQFIHLLHTDAESQFGADLITADLESLKGAVHAALHKLENPESTSHGERSAVGAKLVYLICEERDRKATMPIRKFLKSQSLDVQIPAFEGDAATVRRANQDVLTQCDAILVFYGAGDESWKRTVDSDLKKLKAYRGQKPLLTAYTYLAEPRKADKEELIELSEPNLIEGFETFSEAAMRPFLQALQRA